MVNETRSAVHAGTGAPYPAQILILALVYFGFAKAALLLALPPGYATAIWPPSGIALAAILLLGSRMWPGVWLGAMLTNLTVQGSPLLALTMGTGNTLEAVVAGALVHRYINQRGEFDSGEAVILFFALSAMSASIAAVIGSLSLALSGAIQPQDFSANAWTWFQGDASGMVILTPLLLAWRRATPAKWSVAQKIEVTGLFGLLVIAAIAIFRTDAMVDFLLPLAFIVLPFILWAAIRFEQREVTSAIAVVSLVAVWHTVRGRGPFSLSTPDVSSMILLTYTSTLVLTGLVLSAVMRQRTRAESALRQRMEELQEGERHINEFLAMLSHELRNPLAPMVNALALMRRETGSPNPSLLAMIERQVVHLSRIVDDLLDVSRITRGKILLHKTTVDLNDIVKRAIEASQPMVAARGHKMDAQFAAGELLVDADSTRLSQVVLNLINNAAKYTPAGGNIAVSVGHENQQAVLRVRDSGIGIAPALLPKVFDLFTQGDRALDRSEGGLGIGLTIARRLVEMHEGTIVARSAGLGQGSEFVVRLPARSVAALPAAEPEPAPIGRSVRRKVLVVDDHRENADTLAMLLVVMGHDVKTAYDGQQAINLAAQFRPQVVLLDIGLPGMNGYEVAGALKALQQEPEMILIAVSGYGQDEDRRRSSEAGFDHHLVKPVDPAQLALIIDGLAIPDPGERPERRRVLPQ